MRLTACLALGALASAARAQEEPATAAEDACDDSLDVECTRVLKYYGQCLLPFIHIGRNYQELFRQSTPLDADRNPIPPLSLEAVDALNASMERVTSVGRVWGREVPPGTYRAQDSVTLTPGLDHDLRFAGAQLDVRYDGGPPLLRIDADAVTARARSW